MKMGLRKIGGELSGFTRLRIGPIVGFHECVDETSGPGIMEVGSYHLFLTAVYPPICM
jgi:hypothetical protein